MIIWHPSIARMPHTSLFTILTRISWTIIEIKQSLIPKIWSSGIGRTGSQFAIRQWAAPGMMCKSHNYYAEYWRRIFQLEWDVKPKILEGTKHKWWQEKFLWLVPSGDEIQTGLREANCTNLNSVDLNHMKKLFQEIELKSYHTHTSSL